MRLFAVPVAAALLAASCGGGDDDSSDGDDSEQGDDSDADDDGDSGGDDTDDSASDDSADDSDDGDGSDTDDADTDDGSPVVETIAPEENTDPVMGGTLRYGLQADVNGLNPTTSSLSSPGTLMTRAVFDSLAAITPDNGTTPYLAESFEASEDLKSWTVVLRGGISFHDGEPLNADALIANFEATRSSAVVGLAVKPFFPEEGAVEKVDDLTVIFHLLDPHANYPTYVTGQLGMIASPVWLAAALEDPTLNQEPVGTGPFKFESRSEDSVTRFVRNDDWWGGDVYLDAVEFFPVTDPDARVDLLTGGELEALQATNPASILDLRDNGDIQNVLDDRSDESFMMFNTAAPPFDDIRAREALSRATPRQLYIDLIGLGVIRGADQRFIPESPFHNPDVKQVSDDPEGAVALAAEYCAERGSDENPIIGGPTCTDGKINIEYQRSGPSVVGTRVQDLMVEGWGAAFNVTVDELFEDEHIGQTAIGQFNVLAWRQFGANDPASDNVWLLCRTIGGISINWPRYCDEERDALLLQAQATTDVAERAEIYQQAEAMINSDFLYIFLTHTLWDNAFSSNIHGVCDRTSPEGVELKCAQGGTTWFDTIWID